MQKETCAVSKAILWHCFFLPKVAVPTWKFQKFHFCVLLCWNSCGVVGLLQGFKGHLCQWAPTSSENTLQGMLHCNDMANRPTSSASHRCAVAQMSTVACFKGPGLHKWASQQIYFSLRNWFMKLLDFSLHKLCLQPEIRSGYVWKANSLGRRKSSRQM